jgi:hypothetical protein
MSKDYYTSVSLAALVGADERLKDAHRQSVNEAVKYCEEYIKNDLTPDPNALDIKL